jgi:hypothetical protein
MGVTYELEQRDVGLVVAIGKGGGKIHLKITCQSFCEFSFAVVCADGAYGLACEDAVRSDFQFSADEMVETQIARYGLKEIPESC